MMPPGAYVPVSGRGFPDPAGEARHLLGRHRYRRIVVRGDLRKQDGLLSDGLLQARSIDEGILDPVPLRDDRHDGEDVPVGIDVLGLEADRIAERLVPGHLVRRDVHETDRLGCRDHRSDLVVDGEQFEFPRGVLGPKGKCRSNT